MERLSIDSEGTEAALGATVSLPDRTVDASGRFVVFASESDDLVADDGNEASDVFLHDRVLGTTVRVSVNKDDGGDASGASANPCISDNGRFVAFCSDAHNLVDDDSGLAGGVFSHDRLTGITRRHSVTMSGEEAWDYSRRPSLTPDGAFMVFESGASNFVPDDTNMAQDVFIAWGPAMVWCDGFESGELAGWSSATN